MSHSWAGAAYVARVTYGAVVRMPIYYVLLGLFAVVVLASPKLAMFELVNEMHAVREMGFASVVLWGFFVCLIAAPVLVGRELEGRVALFLFPKPFSRAAYLWGKFLGLGGAVAAGSLFLGLVILMTLWLASGLPALHGRAFDLWVHPLTEAEAQAMSAEERTAWGFIARQFLAPTIPFVAGATLLSILEGFVLAAWAVVLAALLPPVASSAALTLLYLLGHMMDYVVAALERGPGVLIAQTVATLAPHLGYFSLPGRFSAGEPPSLHYLCIALAYAVLYTTAVTGAGAVLFHRREIR